MVHDLPPPEPAVAPDVVDRGGLVGQIERLSAGSLRAGRVPLGILSAMLHEGEQVETLVQGVYQQHAAVAALTDRRVLLVNEHEWAPDIRSIPLTADLLVQGWQDDRTASLIFITGGQSVVFSLIVDRALAQELAHRMRARVAAMAS